MRKILRLLTSAALALSLMPAAAFASTDQAAAQIVDEGGSAEAADGSGVTVSKTIEASGIENYFDITLEADVEESSWDNSTAVVLVMDISNTMNSVQAGSPADSVEDVVAGSSDSDSAIPGSAASSTDAPDSAANPAGSAPAAGSAANGLASAAGPAAFTRLQNAQAAANTFIEAYCGGEGLSPTRQLGVITFNTNAQWAEGLQMQSVSPENVDALQKSVNAISAPSTPSEIRFTNMEAGLQLAANALAESDAANKYVIFLTDGFPTTYIDMSVAGNAASSTSIEGYDPYESGAYDPSKVGEDGYFADAVLKLPCTYGTSYSDKAALLAAQVATSMKAGDEEEGKRGINIFSVGIDIGAQTIAEYVDRATGTFSVVDRQSDQYIIGDADDPTAYADWLANSIAGGPSLGEGSSSYADGNDRDQLQHAFAAILEDIKETSGMLLAEALVTDPMGENVEFQYFYDEQGSPVSQLEGEYALSTTENPVDDTASFAQDVKSIAWDLLKSGFTTSEGEDGSRTFHFALKYRVRLANEAMGFPFEEAVSTNATTTLEYTGVNADGSTTPHDPLEFPVPSVQGYAGTLSLAKVSSEEGSRPLEGAVFELRHSDACSYCASAQRAGEGLAELVQVGPFVQASDSDGRVSFANVPSGHDYVLVEQNPPEGYAASGEEYAVSVSYGGVVVYDGEGDAVYESDPERAVDPEREVGSLMPAEPFVVENDPVTPDLPVVPDPPVVPDDPNEPADPTDPATKPVAQGGILGSTGDKPLATLFVLGGTAFAAALVILGTYLGRRGNQ